jgi:hypothetical protein
MAQLKLVWNRDSSLMWEADWIKYLFSGVSVDLIENYREHDYFENSVIIDSICWAPYHNEYIAELDSRGYKYALIHLSDESIDADINSYENCKFVLRNYFRPNSPQNTFHIPLGYNNGFSSSYSDTPITNRKFNISFIAERMDQNRLDMFNCIKCIDRSYFHIANPSNRLSPKDMSVIYSNSIFIPCPKGALNIDSFRVTEALEAGCIPLVETNDYWFNLYGPYFPAIQLLTWNDAPKLISEALSNPDKLEIKRQQCYLWWKNYKEYTKSLIEELVSSHFDLNFLIKKDSNF